MKSKTVQLSSPIERQGEEPITTVTLREPTGKDLRTVDSVKGDVSKAMHLVVRTAKEGITPAELDDLPASDVMKLVDAMGEFMDPDGQSSGQ